MDGCKPMDEDSETTTTKTPPVQASVSPEIQCGSSLLVSAATSAYYGAGHVVSGVTDKRKCRPRGVLTVGGIHSSGPGGVNLCDKSYGDYDDGNIVGVANKSRVSLVPLPVEASVCWLLSPCDEDNEDQKGDLENGMNRYRQLVNSTLDLPISPSYCHELDSDLCDSTNYSGSSDLDNSTSSKKTWISSSSPGTLPEFQGFMGPSFDKVARSSSLVYPPATPRCKNVISQEEGKFEGNVAGENSPFSMDSLNSDNVIQTPTSDSSLDRLVCVPLSNADGYPGCHFEYELDSAADMLLRESVSPRSQISIWDPPGLSFQLTDLTSTSNSINFNQLQRSVDNRASWMSNSTLETGLQSPMRISWREGLVSRIFEMDELDCCRCLSDEENDADGCNNDRLKLLPSCESHVNLGNNSFSSNGLGSPEFLNQEPSIFRNSETKSTPHRPSSSAESICTDGGCLVASRESDWTLCYKNQLFQV
ncbi:unnamed protein product [Ilex paraguariensis]|uniref:Uncharacterized protein n=1 Tax=Ilex paraguariensis TaxID=185542 RepID=A0ABC8S3T0_9AQUA